MATGCARNTLVKVGFPYGVKAAHSATTVPEGAVWFARNVRGRDMGILKTRPGTLSTTPFSGTSRLRLIENLGSNLVVAAWGSHYYLVDIGTGLTLLTSAWTTAGMVDRFDSVHWQLAGEPRLTVFTGAGLYEAGDSGIVLATPYTPLEAEPDNLLEDTTPGQQDLDSAIAKSTVAAMKFGMSMRAACAYENRVYLSGPSDPTYWPLDQVIYLPDDGDDVVSLAIWYDILVIFRRHDIWAFIGDDVTSSTARLVRQAQVGCVARDTVVDVPSVGLMFLGPDNVYALTGVQAISDRVQVAAMGNDIQPMLRMALANDGATDACAIYHDSEYLLSMSNFTGADKLFVFQTTPAPAWWIDSAPSVCYWLRHDDALYSVKATPNGLQHHSYDYATDNGQAIPVEIHFGQEMLPVYSKIRRLFVLLQGQETIQNINVSITTDGLALDVKEFSIAASFGRDFAIDEGAIEIDRIGRVTEMRSYEARIAMKGQYIQLVITGTGAGERIGVAGYVAEYITRAKGRGIRSGVVQTWPT